jgi:hypothetical protein
MQLVMYVGNDFIASVSMKTENISQPGYVGQLKRELIKQNSEILQGSNYEPDFLVVNFSHPLPNYKGC